MQNTQYCVTYAGALNLTTGQRFVHIYHVLQSNPTNFLTSSYNFIRNSHNLFKL